MAASLALEDRHDPAVGRKRDAGILAAAVAVLEQADGDQPDADDIARHGATDICHIVRIDIALLVEPPAKPAKTGAGYDMGPRAAQFGIGQRKPMSTGSSELQK